MNISGSRSAGKTLQAAEWAKWKWMEVDGSGTELLLF
jgi:hypothetical protein